VRMVVSELRGEKIDIIPWNTEPARFVAKALSPARVREVYLDDEGKDATVVVPDDQLALAIGKEGMNARLAARLTGWKIDIVSDTEFAQQEADAAFGGGSDDVDFSGRCAAVLANGKRCPNAALPGSRFCGVPAHQELAKIEAETGEYAPGSISPVTEAAEAAEAESAVTDGGEPSAVEEAASSDGVPVAEEAPVADESAPEPVAEQAAEEPVEPQETEIYETPATAAVIEDEAPAAVADPVEATEEQAAGPQ
jgi:N utilization substance protein A